MIIRGSISIFFRGECNCTGCFYTRQHGGYMPCQNQASKSQKINTPPKKPVSGVWHGVGIQIPGDANTYLLDQGERVIPAPRVLSEDELRVWAGIKNA